MDVPSNEFVVSVIKLKLAESQSRFPDSTSKNFPDSGIQKEKFPRLIPDSGGLSYMG